MTQNHHFSRMALLAEMIASRLVHEIVGPIGAISNGLELIEELGAEAGEDATSLVSRSAKEAGTRLQFYRMAYGRSGHDITNIAQFKAAAVDFIEDSPRHTLSWPMPPILPTLTPGLGRVALILIEIAHDCLARGGVIRVTAQVDRFEIIANGPDIAPEIELLDTLEGRIADEDLTPRTVHAALARAFAEGFDGHIIVEKNPNELKLSVERMVQ